MMKTILTVLAAGALLAAGSGVNAQEVAAVDAVGGAQSLSRDTLSPGLNTSILRVNVTAQSYNFYQPWEKGPAATRRGLGALLADGNVLVTAQLVADSTYIELEHPRTGEKATAELSVVDYEANLALVRLKGEKPDFLADFVPMEVDGSLKFGDTLNVWQIQDSGTPVSTPCEFLQVDTARYFVSGSQMLVFEIKGSLQYHAGSFVLPVAKGNRLAGLLLSYDADQQISKLLPAPIIQHFLKDASDGKYAGFPTFGMAFSRTTDEQLRGYLKLEKNGNGVFVSAVLPGSTAGQCGVKTGDVLMAVNGYTVDARGNYDHPDYGKLSFSHLVRGSGSVGDPITLSVWRDGALLELKGSMSRKDSTDYLIDPYMFDRGPNYLIAGGLVFQELARPYLEMFGNEWEDRAPLRLVWALAHPEEFEEKGREKLVFLSRVIQTPVTVGYEGLSHVIVDEVNGKKITKLSDLAEALKSPVNGLHQIILADAPNEIFLEPAMTDMVNQRIQQAFRIGSLSRIE